MTEQFRTEKDSMGEFQVPINAKYGASTARAVENFPISNLRFSRSFIKALGEIKKACAKVNQNNKLLDKTLAIIEPRAEYKRDKTWSFWKTFDHNFDDCVIKSWNNFSINTASNSHQLSSEEFPYQSIDSSKFYKKINSKLSRNKNISFFRIKSSIGHQHNRIDFKRKISNHNQT